MIWWVRFFLIVGWPWVMLSAIWAGIKTGLRDCCLEVRMEHYSFLRIWRTGRP